MVGKVRLLPLRLLDFNPFSTPCLYSCLSAGELAWSQP